MNILNNRADFQNKRMKCVLVIVILLLNTYPIYAQNSIDSTFIKFYFPTINQAELALMQNNYQQAIDNYQVAFGKVNNKMLVRDLYNAAVCAAKIEDNTFVYTCLKKAILKGMALNFIQSKPVFKSFWASEQGKKLVDEYLEDRKVFINNTNAGLIKELHDLSESDQYFRHKENHYVVYADTIKKIDDSNIKRILEIMNTIGFPDESMIGVGDSLRPMPEFLVIVWHQSSYKNYEIKQELIKILEKASVEGKIDPHVFGRLTDHFSGLDKYMSKPIFKVDCANPKECEMQEDIKDKLNKWVYYPIPIEKEEKVNKIRSKVGLEPEMDFVKKIIFGKKTNEFYFNFLGGFTTYSGCTTDAAEMLLKNAELLN